jgi:hypothetical protein
VGVVLILAVASIAALQEGGLAGKALTWRLIAVAAIAVLALAGWLAWKVVENKQSVWDLIVDWVLRLLLVVVVLGVGWFLGRPGGKKK